MLNDKVHIRFANPADFEAMYAIYRPYVCETAVSFETEPPGAEEFSRRIQQIMQKYPCFVAEKDHHIIGYAYANAFKDRSAYDRSVETTIYLDQSKRRMGAGRRLYTALEEQLLAQGICNLNACIGVPREESDPYLTLDSILFHTRMGYRMVGQFDRCGYKFDRWYDMAWMEKHIADHPVPPMPVQWFSDIRKQFPQYE